MDGAALDARILLESVAGRGADSVDFLTDSALSRLDSLVRRRLAGEPVWRILGEREFWGLPFKLSPATLEPRPDSETLVDAALQSFAGRRDEELSVLDLGTGTGCLLIAVLTEFPHAMGLGVDVSQEASETARANAEINGVARRVRFSTGDWTSGLTGSFDLILSNPPYIPTPDIAELSREVRDHDPRRALDGGEDGLDPYRRFADALPPLLAPGGIVLLEIGAGQEDDVVALVQAGGLVHKGSRRDLGGHPRALIFAHS